MELTEIEEPIHFNALKHHKGGILKLVNKLSGVDNLSGVLKVIGGSQMDLYTGSLSINQITAEVTEQLSNKEMLEVQQYKHYLRKGGGYRLLQLSDLSKWVLLEGTTMERYIHIHPARFSRYTTRVKAHTMKTVISVLVQIKSGKSLSLTLINDCRKSLNLSPVKSVRKDKGIGALLTLFGACL